MRISRLLSIAWLLLRGITPVEGEVVFEMTSPYHHIQVIDQAGVRTLSFDGTMETRMSLQDPLQGHFGYTEFFHMPFLWNARITNVLMIGLGGASTQRSYAHFYPDVSVQTAELDAMVLDVAREYFHFKATPRQKVEIADGRVFLRRSKTLYDVILMDAYQKSRYGSFIPYHLVTKEFFVLASEHLQTNGVIAYNVIGSLRGQRADIVGAVYKTMQEVFPQVYSFPASDSENIVLLATKSPRAIGFNELHQRASFLIRTGRIKLPSFRERVYAVKSHAPLNLHRSPILKDDFAPVDGLLRTVPQ